jgi:hypothetical protein
MIQPGTIPLEFTSKGKECSLSKWKTATLGLTPLAYSMFSLDPVEARPDSTGKVEIETV